MIRLVQSFKKETRRCSVLYGQSEWGCVIECLTPGRLRLGRKQSDCSAHSLLKLDEQSEEEPLPGSLP